MPRKNKKYSMTSREGKSRRGLFGGKRVKSFTTDPVTGEKMKRVFVVDRFGNKKKYKSKTRKGGLNVSKYKAKATPRGLKEVYSGIQTKGMIKGPYRMKDVDMFDKDPAFTTDVSKYKHGGMTMNSPSLLDNVKTTYEMGGVMKEYGMGGKLKEVGPNQKGLAKLPTKVRNKMGYMRGGGMMKEYGKGGKMEYGHGGMMNGGMMRQHD